MPDPLPSEDLPQDCTLTRLNALYNEDVRQADFRRVMCVQIPAARVWEYVRVVWLTRGTVLPNTVVECELEDGQIRFYLHSMEYAAVPEDEPIPVTTCS